MLVSNGGCSIRMFYFRRAENIMTTIYIPTSMPESLALGIVVPGFYFIDILFFVFSIFESLLSFIFPFVSFFFSHYKTPFVHHILFGKKSSSCLSLFTIA